MSESHRPFVLSRRRKVNAQTSTNNAFREDCVASKEGRVMTTGRSIKQVLVIGGHRVVFIQGDGWKCTCELSKEGEDCTHMRMAAALVTLEHAVIALGGSISRH
jgi:hypothetical protein